MAPSRTDRLGRITAPAPVLVALLVALLLAPAPARAGAGGTTRVSVATDGAQANHHSFETGISADGRFVTFFSYASNLVPDDRNGARDVFVHDRLTGAVSRVSVSSSGLEAVGDSHTPAISADGRFVTFVSAAPNLVTVDANAAADVFVHDRVTGQTSLVSRTSDGAQATGASTEPSISGDGRRVAFVSSAANLGAPDTNAAPDVFVHDRQTGTTTLVSAADAGPPGGGGSGNGASSAPSISVEGRHVAFHSDATDLLGANGDTNARTDVFVRDLDTATTTRVSIATDGSQGDDQAQQVSISADGRVVAFQSKATNLVGGDTNKFEDIFVHDRTTAATTRVSLALGGAEANNFSFWPVVSGDGTHVAFASAATNLVVGDTSSRQDIFRRHLAVGTTTRVNVTHTGSEANDGLHSPFSVDHDGRHVAFGSSATDLVPGDTNGRTDIFVRKVPDDHTPPVVSIGDASVAEKDTGSRDAVFTVSLSKPAADPVSVAWATADGTAVAPGDYAASSGTVSFPPGSTVETLRVAVHGDEALEGHETFTVSLSAPDGLTLGDATAAGTILDDDPVASVGDATVSEGDVGPRAAVFTVSLSKPSPVTVTVDYATANGTATAGQDYTARAGSLSFAPGVTSQVVKVPVAADTVDDPAFDRFTFTLSALDGAIMGDAVGVGTIVDDDPATAHGRRLSIGDVVVHEGDAGARTAFLNVSLSEPSGATLTVDFATAKGTAIGTDFVAKSGTLSFPPGSTSLNVKIVITPDTADEPDEAFTVRLSNVTGGGTFIADDSGSATIVDDD